MSTHFTHPEAESKLGKMVILKTPLYQLPRGTTGRVVDTYKMGSGFGLVVHWGNMFDGFSKDDYERFLEEV